MFSVPPRVTAPVVEVEGVRPVVPPLNDKTPVLLTVIDAAPLVTLTPDPACRLAFLQSEVLA